MLDALDLDDPVVGVRYSLERGRLHNSAGAPVEAARHFRRAADLAAPSSSPQLTFLRIDALHMLAIAEPEGAEDHTALAVQELAVQELAAVDDRAPCGGSSPCTTTWAGTGSMPATPPEHSRSSKRRWMPPRSTARPVRSPPRAKRSQRHAPPLARRADSGRFRHASLRGAPQPAVRAGTAETVRSIVHWPSTRVPT